VCAAVVGDLDSAEIHDWLAGRVAPYKRPKQVLMVDSIPMSPTGKVRRAQIAAALGLEQ
jgi:acyl-CoA synthetase (AMP-forming)/AMP-acid ligase II